MRVKLVHLENHHVSAQFNWPAHPIPRSVLHWHQTTERAAFIQDSIIMNTCPGTTPQPLPYSAESVSITLTTT